MQTFILKLEAGGGYEARVAISGNINLYGLAEHLIDTLGFDFDHAFGFYGNVKDPHRSEEKYMLFADMGESEDGEPGVNRTLINDVFEPKKKMLFRFDYGDDWQSRLTCMGVEEAPNKRKVRKVISTIGTPPVQYPQVDEVDE